MIVLISDINNMIVSQSAARLRIFTWPAPGNYLYYLSLGNYDLYIPVLDQQLSGKADGRSFGLNVYEIPAAQVKEMTFDVILFQEYQNFSIDQYELLSAAQRLLPKLYVEHELPAVYLADTRHPVDDLKVTLVHVTSYNRLMWDNHDLVTHVIDYGVQESEIRYTGELNKGIVVVNDLQQRGRLYGYDLFKEVQRRIPLDLAGIGSEKTGLGEISSARLPAVMSHYRFFFNPIRYLSIDLGVCEAMMLGMPVVGLANAEFAMTVRDGYSGFIDTSVGGLVEKMRYLMEYQDAAIEIGANAKEAARAKFSISRFTAEWEDLFNWVVLGLSNPHLLKAKFNQ